MATVEEDAQSTDPPARWARSRQEAITIRWFRNSERPNLIRPLTQTARSRQLRQQAIERARAARVELLLLVPILIGVAFAYTNREELFGLDKEVRIATVLAMVGLGWAVARAAGRALAPTLLGRLDAGTAGTLGFIIRLFTLCFALLVALRIAGLRPETLAVGGAFTAVILGLAAQQTIGNLFAGLVLLSARPFRVGERVRLQAGGLAGQTEGTVASLGLLYVTLGQGGQQILVPNNIVLTSAVVPLREPAAVDLRARVRPGVKPTEVQALLERAVTIPTRDEPHIGLEEVDADEVVMRIAATPERDADGPRLADEILAAMVGITRRGDASENRGNGRPELARAASDAPG